MTHIYGLFDPRNDQLRYIGVTKQKLRSRLSQHLACKGKGRRTNWIKSLMAVGLKPEISSIEEIDDSQRDEQERFWITYFRYIGANLTNETDGGIGTVNLSRDARVRNGDSHRGRKHTAEELHKMSIAHRGENNPSFGRVVSKETREKLSASLRGKIRSDEARVNYRLSKLGKKNPNFGKPMPENVRNVLYNINVGRIPSIETKEKISLGNMGKHVSKETRMKIAKSRMGKPLSIRTKEKLSERMSGKSNPFYGKSHTDESKEKNRIAHIGKHVGSLSPRYGKKASPETIKKLRDAALRQWERRKSVESSVLDSSI